LQRRILFLKNLGFKNPFIIQQKSFNAFEIGIPFKNFIWINFFKSFYKDIKIP